MKPARVELPAPPRSASCAACACESAPGSRFCDQCGSELGRRCVACGAEGGAAARFCASCGARFDGGGLAVPSGEPDGERRQLTILFCDLVGSTELAARLDPEDWQDVLRNYQARARAVIERYGGHVAQYLGDGILVYFGWPKAYDDAAERAVRAGIGLVDAAAALHAEGAPTHVRVGLHTGPVVVSVLGGEGGSGRLALGDAPNVAARIHCAAAPGTVLLSAATQRLVAGLFVVEDRGPQQLDGVREPMTLYRVVQPSGMRSRLDVAAGRLTRFVGREVELATLVERWDRVQDGEGQNVLVLGEAGVGKSRLAYQLRERVAEVPHTWLECGASPYAQGTPFHPVIALASQALGLVRDDAPPARLARLHAGLGKLATPEAVALLADFLGLRSDATLDMNPDLQRRKTLDLLAQWNLAQSEAQPLVLVVEDLHWCDASSLELLGRVVAQSATARVLLLMTARPDFTPPWPARENTTTLSLARLTRRQAREMIAALEGGALPSDTLDALVARADGVPLFLEELTKSVVQSGAKRDVAAIPTTLADSLMARLDQLSDAKDVAQRAAVLGREFAYPLLAAVSGLDEASLRQSLVRLAEAEVLFVRGEPPDATYTFKHALVQEAARESLLKRTQQQLHGRVVDVLLEYFPARALAEPELVARHAEAAGRIDAAVAYYQRAGERAQGRSAHAESIHHLEQAIALLVTQRGCPERDAREAPLQLALAESRAVALGYTSPRVEEAHERARVLCEAVGDMRGLGFALSGLAVFSYNSGRAERAFALADGALTVGEQIGDPELLLRAHCDLGLIQVYRGEFVASMPHFDAALELVERPGFQHRALSATGNPGVRAHSASAWALWALGFPDRALARARQGVARARELAHPFSVTHALLFETVVHALRREVTEQRERAAEVIALSDAHGFPFWMGVGQTFHAAARVAAGEHEAVADLRKAFAQTAATGSRGGAPASLAQLGQACLTAGLLDEAQGAVDGGLALAAQTGQAVYDSVLHLLQARIHLARGAAAEAEASFRRAVAIARAQGTRSFELRAATGLAQLLRDQGARDEARALLAPLYAGFTEGFDTADLVAARAVIDSIG